jgi:hypothetical protein
MKYKVVIEIVQEVEAVSEKDARDEAWFLVWETAGASNPERHWFKWVERVDTATEFPPENRG